MKNTLFWLNVVTRIYPFSQSHTLRPLLVLKRDDFMSRVSLVCQSLLVLSEIAALGGSRVTQQIIVSHQTPSNLRMPLRIMHTCRP